MPGMAEPDIAIDIISATGRMSEVNDTSATLLSRRPRLALRTFGLIGLDAVVTAVAALVCYALFNPLRDVNTASVAMPIAVLTVCATLSFLERGLYAASAVVSSQLKGRKILLAWVQAVSIGTLVTFCVATISGDVHRAPVLGGMIATLRGAWLPLFLVSGFGAVAVARLARIRLLNAATPLNRTVIIGEVEAIHDLVLRLRTGNNRAFDIVGLVEHAAQVHADGVEADVTVALSPLGVTRAAKPQASFLGLPLFGGVDVLEQMIRQDAVDTVLVAVPWSSGDQARIIVRRISLSPVDVYVYPGIHALNIPLRRVGKGFELPLLLVCNRPIDGWRATIKRAEDIVFSAAILLFISPVMLAIAAAVKATSKGPVLFRQRRLGYNNRVIEVMKFRSMYTHLADADAQVQACRGDKRVTRVGAWLRKRSLDELPQLLNVLKGDMSLVGPRPHALATTAGGLALEQAVPVYSARHRVKPGITGWAQVNGHRGALDSVEKIVHRVNHDLYYIENWSLLLDLKILCQTIKVVFADDNAF